MNTRLPRTLAAATLVVLLALTACEADDSDAEAPADSAEVEASEAEADEPAEPDLASEDVEQALLDTLGVENFRELEPSHWGYYIAEVEVPNSTLVRLTMQTDEDDPTIQGASETAFSLVGGQFEDVSTFELVDGAGNHIEQTRRSNVPLLN